MGPACAPRPGPGAAVGPAFPLWLLASEDPAVLLVRPSGGEEGPDSLAGSGRWGAAKPPAGLPGLGARAPAGHFLVPALSGPRRLGARQRRCLAPAGLGRASLSSAGQARPPRTGALAVVPLESELGVGGCLAKSPRAQGSTPCFIFTPM